jgi:hypothetical protein
MRPEWIKSSLVPWRLAALNQVDGTGRVAPPKVVAADRLKRRPNGAEHAEEFQKFYTAYLNSYPS